MLNQDFIKLLAPNSPSAASPETFFLKSIILETMTQLLPHISIVINKSLIVKLWTWTELWTVGVILGIITALFMLLTCWNDKSMLIRGHKSLWQGNYNLNLKSRNQDSTWRGWRPCSDQKKSSALRGKSNYCKYETNNAVNCYHCQKAKILCEYFGGASQSSLQK